MGITGGNQNTHYTIPIQHVARSELPKFRRTAMAGDGLGLRRTFYGFHFSLMRNTLADILKDIYLKLSDNFAKTISLIRFMCSKLLILSGLF